jgi:antitoxin VapB
MTLDRRDIQNELNFKTKRIQCLLDQHSLDALLLRRVSSFAWATCGAASYVNIGASEGASSLLITPNERYLITNNIEVSRLEKEEKLAEQGWEFLIEAWYANEDHLGKIIKGKKLGADGFYPGAIDLSGELAWLRSQMTPEEIQRFHNLSALCAAGMRQAVDAIRPGMTEHQIASLLSQAVESRGVQAIVNLIATDERVFTFRHPLPTQKPLQRYAMLVLCGRKWGLVCSLTRLVYFGRIPEDIGLRSEAVAQVDAAMIAATRPDRTLADVFRQAQEAYAAVGFPDEWKLHHQGGVTGYEPREVIATPTSHQSIQVGQTYSWNPSITGTKSEDTILVGEWSNEILTDLAEWPTINVRVNSQLIRRPAILVIE